MLQFRLKMNPPTVTAQEHKVMVRNGKPVFYDTPKLKDARAKIMAYLSQVPHEKMQGPLLLIVTWCFLVEGKHKHGEWRDTKPDTDNLQKLLKDCMTATGFWADDCQVVREIVEKIWVEHLPGIYVTIKTIKEYEEEYEAIFGQEE